MVTATRKLEDRNMRSYTFAAATTKSDFELHATGCRDLAKLPPTATTWVVIADSPREAIEHPLGDQPESSLKGRGVKINACCANKRMDAAGRGPVMDADEVTALREIAADLEQTDIAEEIEELLLAEQGQPDTLEEAAGLV